MPINLSFLECGLSGCETGYFLGSSRTFTYYASKFTNWQFGIPELSFFNDAKNVGREFTPNEWIENVYSIGRIRNFIPTSTNFKPNDRCIGSYATNNLFITGYNSFGEKSDYIHIQKNIGLVSKDINQYTSQAVKFRDNGIINGILSPLFIGYWLGGCGQPCYPCAYEDVYCGDVFSMMYEYTDNMDQYWDINNTGHCPYFYTGFIVDYYGRIDRGPEPNIGWYDYVFGNQSTCSYCHCIIFCILKQCIDGWFATRNYHSKIFLFDQNAGIPYLSSGNIANFSKKVNEYYSFGNLNIKLNHLADEGIFVGGMADFQYGNIDFFKDKDGNIDPSGVDLYGRYISGINSFDYFNKDLKNKYAPEASFTSGDGSYKAIIDAAIRGTDLKKNTKLIIPDLAVRKKTEAVRPEITGYGWIHVDIPNSVQVESTSIKFTMDGGDEFPPEVAADCPALGCDLPLTISSQKLNRFYVRSTREDPRKLMEYWKVPSELIEGSSSFYLPRVIYNGKSYNQEYYKRYIKKIVKAPYNLYVKSGENKFRVCKLGETLKNLEAGRYYFPNPIRGGNIFGFPDGASIFDNSDSSLIKIDEEEEAEFRSIFQVNLNQFFIKNLDDKISLESGYYEAVKLLGDPKANSIRMEMTDSVEFTDQSNTVKGDPTSNLFKSIADLAEKGLLDPNTVAKLKEAGLI